MILDHIDHLNRYNVPHAKTILKFIADNNCAHLADGEIEILGRELFVRVMSYVPKPAAENKFEHHHKYADLQYVVTGVEIMQTTTNKALEKLSEYDEKGDYQFFQAPLDTSSFIVKSGEFAVFYPTEAHRPSCLYHAYEGTVKKLVFKVKIHA